MFQNTWWEPVFSSPLVRSPQPKKRSPGSRRFTSRGRPSANPGSAASAANTTPSASVKCTRFESAATWADPLGVSQRMPCCTAAIAGLA